MKFKELREKYKNYNVVAFGRPLKQQTIPFTMLPKDKQLDDCEVVEIKKVDKEYFETSVEFKTMKKIKQEKKNGHIYVYVK